MSGLGGLARPVADVRRAAASAAPGLCHPIDVGRGLVRTAELLLEIGGRLGISTALDARWAGEQVAETVEEAHRPGA